MTFRRAIPAGSPAVHDRRQKATQQVKNARRSIPTSPIRPRPGVLPLLCGLVVLFALGLGAASAGAFESHVLTGSFGPGGPGVGAFSRVVGVAVDQQTGDVYVYDGGAGAVYKFNAAGTPVSFSSTGTNSISVPPGETLDAEIAVDGSNGPTKGDIYVAHFEDVSIYDEAGKEVGSITEEAGKPWSSACGVAVDSSGNVYVGVAVGVNRYTPSGSVVKDSDYSGSLYRTGTVCNLAANGPGRVYAKTGFFGGPVVAYEPSQFNTAGTSASRSEVDSDGSTFAFGVDLSTNDVFIDEQSQVAQYDTAGTRVGAFSGGSEPFSESYGVAATGGAGAETVYVADDNRERVDVFGPAVQVAETTTEAASEIKPNDATLNGKVNPEGMEVTGCEFEYGTETSYGQKASCSPSPGSGGSPVAVSAQLTGLAAGTTYHFRVVATDANGTDQGQDQSFTTPPAVVALSTLPASEVKANSAVLHGSFEGSGVDTHCHFQYGPGGLTETTVSQDEGSAVAPAVVSVEQAVGGATALTGLVPASEYRYRIVCEDEFGTSYGPEEGFTTPVAVNGVQTLLAGEVTETTAVLHGQVEPLGTDTHCDFEYAPGEEPFGAPTASQDTGAAASGSVTVNQAVSGLAPGVKYRYRIVCENEHGKTAGNEMPLVTPATPPSITGAPSVSGMSRTSVTIGGWMASANGFPATYHVEYGPSEAYGYDTPRAPVGEASEEPVGPVVLGELLPGTVYHYRLVVENVGGVVHSPDQTFTTAAATPPIVSTGGASEVTFSSALLAGTVDSQGLDASYAFQVTSEPQDFGLPSGASSIGAGSGVLTASLRVQGLRAGTTYYYRILATSTDGTNYGETRSFTTQGFPSLLSQPAAPPLLPAQAAVPPSKTQAKPAVKAKRRARAPRCRAKHNKKARRVCERQARKRRRRK
jgi:phosphodiesterase/alkaline phosphatase D-like protein